MLLSGSNRAGGHHTSKLFSVTKLTRNLYFLKYRWDLMIKLNCRKKSSYARASLSLFTGVQKLELSENPPVPEKEEKWHHFYSQSCLFSSAETWSCRGVLCASRALRGLQSCCLCTEGFLSFNLALLENVLLIPVVILLCVISLHYLVQKMKTKRRF